MMLSSSARRSSLLVSENVSNAALAAATAASTSSAPPMAIVVDRLLGGRVDHVERVARERRDPLAVDVELPGVIHRLPPCHAAYRAERSGETGRPSRDAQSTYETDVDR